MTHPDPHDGRAAHGARPGAQRASAAASFDQAEHERLAYALGERFAPHAQAAALAVHEAERELDEARQQLEEARQEEAGRHYRSDRLVFVRAAVEDEREALARRTAPKTVRVTYRHLLDRAVDLAEAEVQGFRDEQAERRLEGRQSVEACLAAERRATEQLDAARAMQQRVADAESTARDGLALMAEKLAGADGDERAR